MTSMLRPGGRWGTSSFLLLMLGFGPVVLAAGTEVPEPIKLRVAYSPRVRSIASWSAGLDCAVARAGSVLAPALGRDLVVDSRKPWFGASVGRSMRELRRALVESVDRQDADLVVGLAVHHQNPRHGRPAGIRAEPVLDFTEDEGLAHYTEGYLVLDVRGTDLCEMYRLLAHEIAHIYGGVHRRGKELLMNRGGRGVEIDPLNRELLALHRDRGFGKGRAPLSGDELRSMWRLAGANLETPRPWTVVGALAARMGKTEVAVRLYEKSLGLDPDFAEAHKNLGHGRFQLGELEAAATSYRRALELIGDDGLVLNNLAAVYYGLDRAEEALPLLGRALAAGYAVQPAFIAEIEKETGRRVR